MSKKKNTFETFKVIGPYDLNQLQKEEPSCVNFLSYKKTRVTIEEIVESNEVYIKRLGDLLDKTIQFRQREMIKDEIKKLKSLK